MNKEIILEAFFKHRPLYTNLPGLISSNPSLFTEPVLQPSNFEQQFSESSNSSEEIRNRSESHPQSLCSEFSQITLNKAAFDEILKNRKSHNVFIVLSDTKEDDKVWNYKDKDGAVKGSFTGQQMNDYFQLNKLEFRTLIQHKSHSEDYLPLGSYVKRYYKRIAAEKSKPVHHKQIDSKTSTHVHKQRHSLVVDQTIEPLMTRNKRVLSQAVQPNLYFLGNIEEEQDSEDEVLVTRVRSYTANNR